MAKAKPINAMSQTQYEECKRLRNQCAETMAYLQKCKNCRYDVDAEIAKTQEQIESLEATMREFAPPRKA